MITLAGTQDVGASGLLLYHVFSAHGQVQV